MKPHLLFADRGLDEAAGPSEHAQDLATDLGLVSLLDTMADGDDLVREVAEQVLLTPLTDPDDIAYRQAALRDGIERREVLQLLYAVATQAVVTDAEVYPGLGRSSSSSLHRSIQLLESMVELLRQLRDVADREGDGFRSPAFTGLFAAIRRELDGAFFATATDQLERVRFPAGVVVGARLGRGGRGTGFVLREPPLQQSWARRMVPSAVATNVVQVSAHDRSAARALGDLRERGLEGIASCLERASRDLVGFFVALRREVGFYLGAVRLHDALAARGDVVFPEVVEGDTPVFSATGLEDAGLRLRIDDPIVGNDLHAEDRPLVVITGANQGGKSTFLRGVGLAQLMLQAGMVVAASSLRASPAAAIFSHFKRAEDRTMASGKLDEELGRLSAIVDDLEPGALVLFNESFASTNEHEGSQIAQEVLGALLDAGVRVVFVTHGFDLAANLADRYADVGMFLRAERQEGGARTFRLLGGAPEPTSYGMDLYEEVFGG